MKRALAIAVALCTIGVGAFGLGDISGKWEGGLTIIEPLTITNNKLTLNYTDFGWTFTGVLDVGNDLFNFILKGDLLPGVFSLTGKLVFDLTAPDYNSAEFTGEFIFAGLTIGTTIEHWSADDLPTDWGDYCTQTPTVGMLLYTLSVEVAPISLELTLADCCTGTAFNSILVTMTEVELCCDVSFDLEMSFTKAGFNYVSFAADHLVDLCCGIYFGLEVELGVDYKQVTPKFGGDLPIADCFDVGITVGTAATTIENLTIDYVGLTCIINDCSNVLFGTSFTGKAKGTITIGDQTIIIIAPNAPAAWGLDYSFVTDDIAYFEYETLQITQCGAGCCGLQWSAAIKAYWGNLYDYVEGTWTKVPSLFGLSRLAFETTIPVSEAFSLTFTTETNFLVGTNSMSIGWTFTF
ncbi:MAG: hypothetical protein PHY81_00235 [Candidatus Bipolaricaulis anaerobius]|nr:hypothetical protein [Candidatus Bipolaricaulis anaerobius]MDD5763519.1 hypothetical protein [Candidatus Bipolaricaulis anaerobius]